MRSTITIIALTLMIATTANANEIKNHNTKPNKGKRQLKQLKQGIACDNEKRICGKQVQLASQHDFVINLNK